MFLVVIVEQRLGGPGALAHSGGGVIHHHIVAQVDTPPEEPLLQANLILRVSGHQYPPAGFEIPLDQGDFLRQQRLLWAGDNQGLAVPRHASSLEHVEPFGGISLVADSRGSHQKAVRAAIINVLLLMASRK